MVRCRRQPTGPAALWRLAPDRSDEACFATLPSALLATFHRAYLHDKVFSRIPPGAPPNLFSTHQTAREKETHDQHPQRQDRHRGPRRRLPGPARRRRCVVSPVRRCCPRRPGHFLTQRPARRRDAPPRRRAPPALSNTLACARTVADMAAPTTSYVPTGRQMAAPAKCGPRTAARGPSWQHCGGITRLLVPPASKALVTLTFEAIRSSSGSSDQTVRQAAGNPYGQMSSVIAGGTGRAVASAARTMARNLAVTVI